MPYGFIMRRKYLQVTLVHVLAISNSEKVIVSNICLKLQRVYIDKPSNVINIYLCTTAEEARCVS